MTGPQTRATIAGQARAIATAWSPPDAPASWRLTAQTFTAIAEDDDLLDLAAQIPLDRLPPLLLSAAVAFLVANRQPDPLARYYPHPGSTQPPYDDGFRAALHQFCRAERAALTELCATHRYQMNEVGRCLDVLPALAEIRRHDPRPFVLIDLGTGAGLGLHLDRYGYRYRFSDGSERIAGDPDSPVQLRCDVRAGPAPPLPVQLPTIVDRVGIDVEPLDVADQRTRSWLAACVPPEAEAATRFSGAAALAAAYPARLVRGDLLDLLGDVVTSVAADALVCLVDTYVHVFLPPESLRRFHRLIDILGRHRDLEWISVDPLVPLGPQARSSVQRLDVPGTWLQDNREGGVFGVIGRLSLRNGQRRRTLLGRSHPGASWLQWISGRPG